MRLVCATRNPGKIQEFQRLLEPLNLQVVSLNDVHFEDEVEETGTTFQENAYIKAWTVCEASGLPTFADDSGLVVDALDGQPGVYSARYGGDGLDDVDRRRLLLKNMEEIPDGERSARFVCALCLCMPGGRKLEIYDSCEGTIAYGELGDQGFGYDPIFLYGEKSFGEMSDEEKDRVSHRGKAVRAFVKKLPGFIEEDSNADK